MSRRRRRHGPKQIPEQQIIAELGTNLVEGRVLGMGHAWHPTKAAFDAGIDGFIDLRDRTTRESLNLIVQVQVKSTRGKWPSETDKGFEYICEERDLAHWQKGNAPVVLVVTRPDSDEAYWVSIKDWFKDPIRLKSRRVSFSKSHDAFNAATREALMKLAVKPDAGLYSAPVKKHEWLFSNLLRITRPPSRLYSADTTLGGRVAIWNALGSLAPERAEFVYRKKRILTVHDLCGQEWNGIVDRGTVEDFDTDHWALSDDTDQLNDYRELLGRCLSERVRSLHMRHNKDRELYYFEATEDLSPREIPYHSIKQPTSRTVFQKYESKTGFAYYRHTAFESQFRRYDGTWFLDITPTYYYTFDGRRPLIYYESKLRGMKARERNPAVLSQVAFFADILADEEADLFEVAVYPHLGFGELERFEIGVGINDAMWLPGDEEKAARAAAAEDEPEIEEDVDALPELPFSDDTTV